MRSRLSLFVPFLAVLACSDLSIPTETRPGRWSPVFEIADAANDYKRGFYWLPPVVQSPAFAGTFDGTLSPTVEICELVGDACGPVLGTFTPTSGTGGEVVQLSLEDEHYKLNWHTNEFDLTPTKLYRVSVRAGINSTLLGFADVQPVSNGSGLKNVDTDEYIGLVDGRTLPIKFRMETGIVGNVRVEPAEAEAEPGATQQFVAILEDLHGNPASVAVTWSSSDEDIATIDQTGLATAVDDGVATITATADRISGSATLTVVGGTVLVGAGANHRCALNRDGQAFCLGVGIQGQLGHGLFANSANPVAVAGGHTFTAIDLGVFMGCAIASAGEMYCWGNGQGGGLGNGSTANRNTPTLVSGGLTWASLSAGASYACGVTVTGAGYCWGANGNGRLGTGLLNLELTPTPVVGGLTFSMISTGNAHTCGVTTTSQAYCWGDKFDRALGNPGNINTQHELSPVPVLGGLLFSTIAAGAGHTCGITLTGQTYCWGRDNSGQLGDGLPPIPGSKGTPQLVAGGLTFASLALGFDHSCALTPAGVAYCWGENAGGLLGSGLGPDRSSPTAVSGGHVFTSLRAGNNNTCGVTLENLVYCWGNTVLSGVPSGSTPALQAFQP